MGKAKASLGAVKQRHCFENKMLHRLDERLDDFMAKPFKGKPIPQSKKEDVLDVLVDLLEPEAGKRVTHEQVLGKIRDLAHVCSRKNS